MAAKVPFRRVHFVRPTVEFTLQEFSFHLFFIRLFSVSPLAILPQSLFQYSVPYTERFANNSRHARRYLRPMKRLTNGTGPPSVNDNRSGFLGKSITISMSLSHWRHTKTGKVVKGKRTRGKKRKASQCSGKHDNESKCKQLKQTA